MTIANDNLQFRERSATLPFFRFLTQGPNLARKHINIPDDVLAEMDEVLKRRRTTMSKFVLGGIRMALDDARERFGEAANDVLPDAERDPPRPAAAPVLALVPPAAPAPTDIKPLMTLQRHGMTWFDLVPLCDLLRVSPTALLELIDEDDDLLEHDGRPFVDQAGAHELLSLTPDSVRDSVTALWLERQL